MMARPKGGRGKKTEYGSRMIRIPDPLIDNVKRLKDDFYGLEDSEERPVTPPDYLTALEAARAIHRAKKSARISLERLLTSLYGVETKL